MGEGRDKCDTVAFPENASRDLGTRVGGGITTSRSENSWVFVVLSILAKGSFGIAKEK